MNKFLSRQGVASRREADRLIAEGRVSVNGEVVQELGLKVDEEKDRVLVDGKTIQKEKTFIYLMLNKPPGFLVTLKDPFGRPTIRDLVPSFKAGIFPVGRLDLDSEGLLLLTNDGELAFRLTHPRYRVKKVYLVEVEGEAQAHTFSALEKGIFLEGKKTAPAKVSLRAHGPRRSLLQVEIHEGRKREIRKMCEALGHAVLSLKRVGFAGLKLQGLPVGKCRLLRPNEIERIRQQVGLE
ncbi:MAG: pseudouridine synthase [Candidatus Aminicenantales bacterium]